MTASVVTRLEGDALRQLERLDRGMEARRPLTARLAAYLHESTVHRFETETGPDGRRWNPSIRAQVEGGQTLTDRGHLRGGLVQRNDDDSAEVGSNEIYAAIHQFGGTIRARAGGKLAFQIPGGGFARVASVAIPARPFFGTDREDEAELLAIVEDYVLELAA